MAQATAKTRKQSTKKQEQQMEVTELTSAVEEQREQETVNAENEQQEQESGAGSVRGRRGRQMSAERIAEKLTIERERLARLEQQVKETQIEIVRLEQMQNMAPSAVDVEIKRQLRAALKTNNLELIAQLSAKLNGQAQLAASA